MACTVLVLDVVPIVEATLSWVGYNSICAGLLEVLFHYSWLSSPWIMSAWWSAAVVSCHVNVCVRLIVQTSIFSCLICRVIAFDPFVPVAYADISTLSYRPVAVMNSRWNLSISWPPLPQLSIISAQFIDSCLLGVTAVLSVSLPLSLCFWLWSLSRLFCC